MTLRPFRYSLCTVLSGKMSNRGNDWLLLLLTERSLIRQESSQKFLMNPCHVIVQLHRKTFRHNHKVVDLFFRFRFFNRKKFKKMKTKYWQNTCRKLLIFLVNVSEWVLQIIAGIRVQVSRNRLSRTCTKVSGLRCACAPLQPWHSGRSNPRLKSRFRAYLI